MSKLETISFTIGLFMAGTLMFASVAPVAVAPKSGTVIAATATSPAAARAA